MPARLPPAYRARVLALWSELGIAPAVVRARRLPLHVEAQALRPVGLGTDGRDKMLTSGAATAWFAMREAALGDGIELLLISAFRSIEFQAGLIRNKLAKDRVIDEILTVNAPPGCSEHHTGRAVDLGEDGCPPLEAQFENTAACGWLRTNGARFGFTMTYPENNAEGYLYEPWHWCWNRESQLRSGQAGAQLASLEQEESSVAVDAIGTETLG